VSSLRAAFPGLRISDDAADRVAYARDLWPRHHLEVRAGRPAAHRPAAIVWPSSTEEVAALVRWARESGVPLVPFGAGSGVCAGVLPDEAAVVVDLKRMGRIRALDARAPFVEVEAGYMGIPLERALAREGFTLGHFPSSILCSTAGGWIATRSAGQCSGAYGKIEDMVVSLECVTGSGDVVELHRREGGPDLVPLVVGSEGTLAVVTSARLRLHPAPTARGFGAWSFPTTRDGWEAMRALFQAGLRPAVARLYDPFDAMLAKRGGVKTGVKTGGVKADEGGAKPAPGRGGDALRSILKRPALMNEVLHSRAAARLLGGAMLVVVFEGTGEAPVRGVEAARSLIEPRLRGAWEGAAPAERWFEHRYAVSYRQAPVFANGAFVDTFEVAAPWSRLGALYDAVRGALGEHVFVMSHFSHAYPDGCCIYFSFAGSAKNARRGKLGGKLATDWDEACEAVYDRAWRDALQAAVEAGGTIAHHHGVGRSKAPRLGDELGAGIDVVRALMRALDPDGILNPGNLARRERHADERARPHSPSPGGPRPEVVIDRESLLADVDGRMPLRELERRLTEQGLTLDAGPLADAGMREGRLTPNEADDVAGWLARGAPGTRDRWLDPVDQVVAGLEATLAGERPLAIRCVPRRAVGPDLTALFVGAAGRFGRIDRACLRVHPRGVPRPATAPFQVDRAPPLTPGEATLLEAIERALNQAATPSAGRR
jgi:alkyldihydroxyacetonephosphate synthase